MKGNEIIRVTETSTSPKDQPIAFLMCGRVPDPILLTAQHPKHHSDQVQAFDVCQPPAVCGFSKAAWYDGRLF